MDNGAQWASWLQRVKSKLSDDEEQDAGNRSDMSRETIRQIDPRGSRMRSGTRDLFFGMAPSPGWKRGSQRRVVGGLYPSTCRKATTATILASVYTDIVMGFEQLAQLKAQLAKPAEKTVSPSPARAPRIALVAKRKHASAPNTARVDPVVIHIGRLQKRFPAAFPKNPAPKVALKIGISKDLIAHLAELKLSPTELRDALKIWCRGSRYWSALVADAIRVDLSGSEAGRVSSEDASRAQQFEQARSVRAAAKRQQLSRKLDDDEAPVGH